MKTLIMAAAVIAVSALLAAPSPSAQADQARITDAAFLSASRCIAYADLPQLREDAFNTDALRNAIHAQTRWPSLRSLARDQARVIHVSAAHTHDDLGVRRLREDRDAACANFVQTGLVQLEHSAPSS